MKYDFSSHNLLTDDEIESAFGVSVSPDYLSVVFDTKGSILKGYSNEVTEWALERCIIPHIDFFVRGTTETYMLCLAFREESLAVEFKLKFL